MNTNKKNVKKAVRFALLFYAIFIGLSGTIMFSVLLLWVIPKDQLSYVSLPLSMMALFLYGTCVAALVIRSKFFKKEVIANE
jgi:polyferredoxin